MRMLITELPPNLGRSSLGYREEMLCIRPGCAGMTENEEGATDESAFCNQVKTAR